jgi:uncharacterized protein DUF4234
MRASVAQISASADQVKVRVPLNAGLMDLFTLGLYGLYWYWAINNDLAKLGRARGKPELGERPWLSLLAVAPGFILIVPAVVSFLNTGKRVQLAQESAGCQAPDVVNPIVGLLLLTFLPPLGTWYLQREVNRVWAVETSAAYAGSTS